MIGAHRDSRGEFSMRRSETPTKRINPVSGEERWVARFTTKANRRRSAGTFKKCGPCKRPHPDGECCAQHRIWWAYDQEKTSVERDPTRTVGAYANRKWLQLHPRSERTNDTHDGRLRAVLGVDLGNGPLGEMLFADVDRSHAVDLVDHLLRKQGRAQKGAKGIMSTLNAMWNDALDDGWTKTASPFGVRIRVDDPRVQRESREPTLWSWEQMRGMCAAAGQHEAMLRVLCDCGLRIGEMYPLHREDVKLSAGECDELPRCGVTGPHLHVRRKAWQRKEYAGAKGPRGERVRERVVPIPEALAAKLAPVVMATAPDGYVFPAPSGRMWWESDWRRSVWSLAAARVGMDEARPHDFRHSYVSLMRAAGIDPADLAAIAGHSMETATRTYTHPLGRSHDAVRRAAS